MAWAAWAAWAGLRRAVRRMAGRLRMGCFSAYLKLVDLGLGLRQAHELKAASLCGLLVEERGPRLLNHQREVIIVVHRRRQVGVVPARRPSSGAQRRAYARTDRAYRPGAARAGWAAGQSGCAAKGGAPSSSRARRELVASSWHSNCPPHPFFEADDAIMIACLALQALQHLCECGGLRYFACFHVRMIATIKPATSEPGFCQSSTGTLTLHHGSSLMEFASTVQAAAGCGRPLRAARSLDACFCRRHSHMSRRSSRVN